MSVRDTERAVSDRIMAEEDSGTTKFNARSRRPKNRQVETMEQQLKLALGTKVKIRRNNSGRGSIQIDFANPEEFDRLRDMITGSREIRRVA